MQWRRSQQTDRFGGRTLPSLRAESHCYKRPTAFDPEMAPPESSLCRKILPERGSSFIPSKMMAVEITASVRFTPPTAISFNSLTFESLIACGHPSRLDFGNPLLHRIELDPVDVDKVVALGPESDRLLSSLQKAIGGTTCSSRNPGTVPPITEVSGCSCSRSSSSRATSDFRDWTGTTTPGHTPTNVPSFPKPTISSSAIPINHPSTPGGVSATTPRSSPTRVTSLCRIGFLKFRLSRGRCNLPRDWPFPISASWYVPALTFLSASLQFSCCVPSIAVCTLSAATECPRTCFCSCRP